MTKFLKFEIWFIIFVENLIGHLFRGDTVVSGQGSYWSFCAKKGTMLKRKDILPVCYNNLTQVSSFLSPYSSDMCTYVIVPHLGLFYKRMPLPGSMWWQKVSVVKKTVIYHLVPMTLPFLLPTLPLIVQRFIMT